LCHATIAPFDFRASICPSDEGEAVDPSAPDPIARGDHCGEPIAEGDQPDPRTTDRRAVISPSDNQLSNKSADEPSSRE
jgi:hypothetical protein